MSYFLISVCYLRRLVAWELQGAHYSAFSKIIFNFSMDKSSKERLNHFWTSPCYPYAKAFLQRFIPFLQMWCQTFSKWKGNILLHFKTTFNMGANSTWDYVHTWNESHWLDIWEFSLSLRGDSVNSWKNLIFVHCFRGPCMLTSPAISGLDSFDFQYQVWSQWKSLNLVRWTFW